MDKLDQILQVVGENQKTLTGIEVRLGDFDIRFKGLDSRIGRLEDNIVGINTRLMSVEEKVGNMAHLEESVNRTFNKIDGFMAIINRYESEIAATRMKYEFLEERVTTLESNAKA